MKTVHADMVDDSRGDVRTSFSLVITYNLNVFVFTFKSDRMKGVRKKQQ